MARAGTSSNYCRGATSGITAASMATYSWHHWVRSTAGPGAGGFTYGLSIRNQAGAGSNPDVAFEWDHSSASFQQAATHRQADNTYKAAKLTTTLLANTWYSVGANYDGTNLRAYLNGVLETTTAATATNGSNAATVNILSQEPATNLWPAGTVAEVAVWPGAVLTADDFVGLTAGFRAPHFRRDKLAFYAPLLVNNVQLIGAPLTDTGTPVYADHPRIIGRL